MDLDVFLKHRDAFLKAQRERKTPVTYTIETVEIIVNPSVFPPATDTKLLARDLDIEKGQRFLDTTTGSGIIAIIAGLKGATGIAVDINPKAVENAKENIRKYHLEGVEVLEGDLFEKVPLEQFDRIYANGPFTEGEVEDMLGHASFGMSVFANKLFGGVINYLKPEGKLQTIFPEWADTKTFEGIIQKYGNTFKVTSTMKSNDGERTYRLYEVKRSPK